MTNLEETLAPALPTKLVVATSKAHADQLAAADDAERARNLNVPRGPLTIVLTGVLRATDG